MKPSGLTLHYGHSYITFPHGRVDLEGLNLAPVTHIMTLDDLREYCLAKPATEETLPFGPDTLVFKVAGKMFALTGLDEADLRVNLKCDPEYAQQLRERHEEIVPGWHMNKTHWNTVYVENGDLPDSLVTELVDHSYDLVVKSLTKKKRAEFGL